MSYDTRGALVFGIPVEANEAAYDIGSGDRKTKFDLHMYGHDSCHVLIVGVEIASCSIGDKIMFDYSQIEKISSSVAEKAAAFIMKYGLKSIGPLGMYVTAESFL